MKKNIYIAFSVLFITIGFSSCADFLDTLPDNRTSIDTQKKVRQLLASAYSNGNYGMMCEVSSDNIVDNNSPDDSGFSQSTGSYNRQYDECFAWEDMVSSTQQDSPTYIWQACYSAIAAANAALDAIDKLEAEGIDMSAEKGEALISRAYHHFILVNVFSKAYKDDEASKEDLGIPYMEESERVVSKIYDRGTVTDTYAKIKADIEAGLPLVEDSYYSVPKYHFNISAANAFAARFYLYMRNYEKVLECANRVLPSNPSTVLFDAYNARYNTSYPDSEVYAWIDAKSASNLLLMTASSTWNVYSFLPSYARYCYNRSAQNETLLGAGPNWSNRFPGASVWQYDAKYGGFLAKFYYFFEYTDKAAGIGYVHSVRREFTTNETLLCRAEAYLYLGNTAAAIADLDAWSKAYMVTDNLTDAKIRSFYTASRTGFVKPLNNQLMSTRFTIPVDIEPFIHCVLHFRRIETLHDGLRWFDLKRYGIEIEHRIGTPVTTKRLTWNDDRRALQLPQDVIVAGITANPRVNVGDNQTAQQSPYYAPETPSSQVAASYPLQKVQE